MENKAKHKLLIANGYEHTTSRTNHYTQNKEHLYFNKETNDSLIHIERCYE